MRRVVPPRRAGSSRNRPATDCRKNGIAHQSDTAAPIAQRERFGGHDPAGALGATGCGGRRPGARPRTRPRPRAGCPRRRRARRASGSSPAAGSQPSSAAAATRNRSAHQSGPGRNTIAATATTTATGPDDHTDEAQHQGQRAGNEPRSEPGLAEPRFDGPGPAPRIRPSRSRGSGPPIFRSRPLGRIVVAHFGREKGYLSDRADLFGPYPVHHESRGARILMTGGAGFVGSHFVRDLLAAGAAVTVYDNFSTGSDENLEGVDGDLTVVRGDILDYDVAARRGARPRRDLAPGRPARDHPVDRRPGVRPHDEHDRHAQRLEGRGRARDPQDRRGVVGRRLRPGRHRPPGRDAPHRSRTGSTASASWRARSTPRSRASAHPSCRRREPALRDRLRRARVVRTGADAVLEARARRPVARRVRPRRPGARLRVRRRHRAAASPLPRDRLRRATSCSTARPRSRPPCSISPTRSATSSASGWNRSSTTSPKARSPSSPAVACACRRSSQAMRMSYARAKEMLGWEPERLAPRRPRARVEVAAGEPAPVERDELLSTAVPTRARWSESKWECSPTRYTCPTATPRRVICATTPSTPRRRRSRRRLRGHSHPACLPQGAAQRADARLGVAAGRSDPPRRAALPGARRGDLPGRRQP